MEAENSNLYKENFEEKVKTLGLKSKRFSYPQIGSKAKREIDRAKYKHRSDIDIKDWLKLQYYKSDWCEKILKNTPIGVRQISYEIYDELSIEDFREKYEKSNIPVIIKGCSHNWPAQNKWNFDVLKFINKIIK